MGDLHEQGVRRGVCYDLVESKKYRYYFLENGVIFHFTNHEIFENDVALNLFIGDINEQEGCCSPSVHGGHQWTRGSSEIMGYVMIW